MSEAAPAAAPAPSPNAGGNAPVVTEQGPLNAEQTRAAYSDAVAHKFMTPEQRDQALVAHGVQPLAAASSVRADAQAAIDRIMQGKDPAFSAAYTDPKNPGHADARAKMSGWQAAAKGNADGSAASHAPVPMELIHDRSATPAEITESVKVVNEGAAAMGFDPDEARSLVSTLSNSVRSRMTVDNSGKNQGRPMDTGEIAKMDAMLERKWGGEAPAKLAAVEKALASAGKHGAAIRANIRMADPTVAAAMIDNLARRGERLAARR